MPILAPTPEAADVVMGTSADSGSDGSRASSGGFGALPARDVPIRPLPAMRLTWKELHSAAKVLETVAEMQHQHCRHAETLTIHLMSMQVCYPSSMNSQEGGSQ